MQSQLSVDLTANRSSKGKQDSRIFERLSRPKFSIDLRSKKDAENFKMSLSAGRTKRRRQKNMDEELETPTGGLKITSLID